MWQNYNPNPRGKRVGDCAVRAIAKAFNQSWEMAFIELMVQGFGMADMPSSDAVWEEYLVYRGFERKYLPEYCNNGYTVYDFESDNPHGTFVLALGGHVVTVCDGDHYDIFDSGNGFPLYYYEKVSDKE